MKLKKKGSEMGNSYQKMKRSPDERHTRKLNLNILTNTDVFLNQKRVNVCEYTVKTAPYRRHIHLLSSDRERLL